MLEMVTEQDRKVFQEEFAGRLPSKIFDSHVHIIMKESYSPEWGTDKISYLEKTQWQFTVEQFFSIYKEMLPGVEMFLTGFGGPSMKVNRSHASSFGVDNKKVFGLRLLSVKNSQSFFKPFCKNTHLFCRKIYRDKLPCPDNRFVKSNR